MGDPPAPVESATVDAEVVRDQARFDALAGEWAELYAACPTATPFQTHAWLTAWARAYCSPGALRVVVVRSSGRMVAAAPLHLVRRGPWPLLEPLGGSLSDFTDILLAPGAASDDAAAALTRALLAEPGWRLLDLPEVRPNAAARRWVTGWPGGVTRLESATVLELPGLPLPELLARVPGKTAGVLRRKLRKVDASGVKATTVPEPDVPEAVANLLRLHAEQWQGRGVNPEHLSDRFAAHLTEAATRMVADGQAFLVCYCADGEVLGCQLDLVGHDFLGFYLSGISPHLKDRIDVASMQVRHDLELTRTAGLPRFSMLRGIEDYKLRWRPEHVRNERLLLSPPGFPGAVGYPELVRGRAAAVRWAKDRAPWIRDVRDRLVRLRRGLR
jgi:CelD/BcsL family acetyltransferase involved in cellulose biosynthesis